MKAHTIAYHVLAHDTLLQMLLLLSPTQNRICNISFLALCMLISLSDLRLISKSWMFFIGLLQEESSGVHSLRMTMSSSFMRKKSCADEVYSQTSSDH